MNQKSSREINKTLTQKNWFGELGGYKRNLNNFTCNILVKNQTQPRLNGVYLWKFDGQIFYKRRSHEV